jgi:hypothetical protein
MLALKQQLDALPPGDSRRAALLADIQRQADTVTQAPPGGPDEAARRAMASMQVRTRLLAAELARTEQADPRRALSLLADAEPALASMPNGDALLPEVLLIRVQAHMALGENDAATEALVKLLSKREGGQGAAIVYSLLEKLNEELELARAAGDTARMRTVARNRAGLSSFLVRWAEQSDDPGVRKFAYRYRVFDAASKHLAADLEPDGPARKAGWEAAMKLYRALESPSGVAEYRATLDARQQAQSGAYDPAVSYGIAMVSFDLGQFADSRDRLARLLNDRKLGTPVLSSTEDGVRRESDNDQYWEGVLKFIRSAQATGADPAQTRGYLREQYIRWGDRVGGKRWKAEFEALRRELLPDFTAPAATTPAG